jgi:hypothetical protein
MCGNETGDTGGKMGEVKIAVGGTGDTGIVRRNGRQVRMREADKIDGEMGPVEPGVKGNLTFAYKHVWPATSGVSPVGLDGEPENAADRA